MEALVYFLIWAVLIFVMMRFGCGAHVMGHGKHAGDAHDDGKGPVTWIAPESDIDPVCGKTVRTGQAKSTVHDGTVYYFCSRECREQFEAAPQLYVGQQPQTQPEKMEAYHDGH